jgi:hypothetical protein
MSSFDARDEDDAAVLGIAAATVPAPSDVPSLAADVAYQPPELLEDVAGPPPPLQQDAPLPEEAGLPRDVTMRDLFGSFQPTGQTHAEDPEHFDVLQLVDDIFGNMVTETDIFQDLHLETDTDDHRIRILTEHKRLDEVQPIIDIFGDAAIDVFTRDMHEVGEATYKHAEIVECEVPANPYAMAVRPGQDEIWLFDMPKVRPNRQILHFSDTPFSRTEVRPLDTDRAFYTPQNVIQWAKNDKGKLLSNARLVRWSDGSATLHVGSDVYELPDNQDRVLSMLAREVNIRDQHGARKAYVEAVQVSRHVSAKPSSNRPYTVNEALVRETMARRQQPIESQVKFSGEAVPQLRTDQERNKAPMNARNPTVEEAYMQVMREGREKRLKQGHSMKPHDVIMEEVETYKLLCEATKVGQVQSLVMAADAELKGDKLRSRAAAAGSGAHSRDATVHVAAPSAAGRSSKFARSTQLENVDGGAANDEEDEYNFEGSIQDAAPERKRSRSRDQEHDFADLEQARSSIYGATRER